MASSRVQGNKGERPRDPFRTISRVRQGKPSRTAEFVAFNRALGTLAPQVPGFLDPFAVRFLPDKLHQRVERARAALLSGARKSPYPFWQRDIGYSMSSEP